MNLTQSPPKIKVALCTYKTHLPKPYLDVFMHGTAWAILPIPDLLFAQMPIFLEDRATCETDETRAQLLPYIVVTNDKGEIFSYYRGGSGEESRLHGNISIGLGGHVDIAPTSTVHAPLYDVLSSEAHRELVEEIGIRAKTHFEFIGAIIDPTNLVGRVHLGLLTTYRLDAADMQQIALEPGMIEQGEFRSLLDLRRPEVYDRLENWSKAAVDFFLANPSWCIGCVPENCQGCIPA